ncbi:hypothetical protein BSZ32_13005 [Rubritalea profundi]|uniref:Uncharacterized protein n=1 Tax=Rubritalea profundi TaxID=1658618 RepID=A0A2S7U2V0_9BACT|nr:hypothetical protein BSZ32_13005 [Rubritalea profundi]
MNKIVTGLMPAAPKVSWLKSLGSWDAFHKSAERSVGRKLAKTTVKLSPLSPSTSPSQKHSKSA